MRDCPYTPETSDEYRRHVMAPLQKGEGVACFLATEHGHPTLVCLAHTLSGPAAKYSVDHREKVRALQAVCVQHDARRHARTVGYGVVVA